MNMHDMSMPAIWNAVKDGHPVPDLDTARYVVDAIAQASNPCTVLLGITLATLLSMYIEQVTKT